MNVQVAIREAGQQAVAQAIADCDERAGLSKGATRGLAP